MTLVTPVVSPPLPTLFQEYDDSDDSDDSDKYDDIDDPIERRMTRRLSEALTATREATERATAGDGTAFAGSVDKGVSANLCDALVKLIGPFPTLDISVAWARTRPISPPQEVFRYARADAAILSEAARQFRNREPQPDTYLFGTVQRLRRDEDEVSGTINLRTSIDGKNRSVAVVLKKTEYDRAIQAHKERMPIILQGDLERSGQRWRLLNTRIEAIIGDDQPRDEGDQ